MDAFASVPPLPAHFQSRGDVEATLGEMLLKNPGTLALTAGVVESAGAGKTTLAKALCHDEKVRGHFSNGVQWLPFGRERSGAEVLAALASALSVPADDHDDLCRAISNRLAGRRMLLVLDDVWTAEQVDAFAELTAGADGLLTTLFTTRNSDLAISHAVENMRLTQLDDEASLRLLQKCMGCALRASAADRLALLQACHGNAAMLRSVAGLCRKRGIKGALQHLDECRHSGQHFAKMAGTHEYATLFATLEATLSHLGGELSRCALMLATLPEDTSTPLAVVAQLWEGAAMEGERLDTAIATLAEWNLVDADWEARSVALIDLHHDYLRSVAKTELPAWHAHLLRGCARRTIGATVGDSTDAYWADGRRWVYHLSEGGAEAIKAVQSTVVELRLPAVALQPADGDCIARLAGRCTALTSIDIGFNNLDERGALHIVDAAWHANPNPDPDPNPDPNPGALNIVDAACRRSKLVSLGLASCKLESVGVIEIARHIESGGLAALAYLNLEYNCVDSEGVCALASALASSSLASLNLSEVDRQGDGCDGMRGFLALADALKLNTTLASLNLSANRLDAATGRTLAQALTSNSVLTSLDLSSNRLCGRWRERSGLCPTGTFDPSCLEALVDALRGKSALTELSLRCNELSSEGASVATEMVAAGVAGLLRACDLRGNDLGEQGNAGVKEATRDCAGFKLLT